MQGGRVINKDQRTRGITPCKGPSSTLLRFTGRPSGAGVACSNASPSESDDRARLVFVELGSGHAEPGRSTACAPVPSGGVLCRRTSPSGGLTRLAFGELGSGSVSVP